MEIRQYSKKRTAIGNRNLVLKQEQTNTRGMVSLCRKGARNKEN